MRVKHVYKNTNSWFIFYQYKIGPNTGPNGRLQFY